MDPDEMREVPPGDRVLKFLKTETFYVLVLIFVVSRGAADVQRRLAEDGGPGAAPSGSVVPVSGGARVPIPETDLRALELGYRRRLDDLRRKDFGKAIPALAWMGFNLGALMAGTGVMVCALVWRLMRQGASRRPAGRAPRWGLWDVLKLAGMFAAGMWLFNVIFRVDPLMRLASTRGWLADLFGRVLWVGVMVHIVRVERGGRLADLGFRREKLLWGLVLGVMGFFLLQPFLRVIEAGQLWWVKRIPLQEAVVGMLVARRGMLAMAVFAAVVVAPVTEEMFFRGFLQSALQRWVGAWPGIVISAAYFAMSHMDVYAMAPLFVVGLVLGWLFDRTRSLAAPITLHILYNAAATVNVLVIRYVYGAA